MKHTKSEIEDMRETLKVFGRKSETYYDACTDEQICIEYDRLGQV